MDMSGAPGGRTLVIDCATSALSLALFDTDALIASHHAEMGRGHAEALLPLIAAMPGSGRCDRIVVDAGPGSFTGVRVGLAAARALGFAWGVPVLGYDCLDLVGAIIRHDHQSQGAFLLAMIGGHGELFWKRFPADHQQSAHSTPIAALAAQVGDEVVYGSGAPALVQARGFGEAIVALPDARRFPLLPPALLSNTALPIYGRGADAKPMAQSPASAAVAP